MTTTTTSLPLPTDPYARTPQRHRVPRAALPVLQACLATVERSARRAAVPVVRAAIAVLMLWFGIPKVVPGGSPAEDLVVRTLDALTAGVVTGDVARLSVAVLEVTLGVALLLGRCMPLVLLVLLGHMAGTFTPLVLFPVETWRSVGVGTLEGQYVIKNVVVLASIVVLAGWGMRR
ncbi:hypothetical protein [Curtobacterium caseinilyticum]|uniref:DoxX family membrane protein n=1 Tax=Curtobacterium caseinilyticum TaxID=3055137 RepID=A0ABT7TS34_9MICO|nr:hypothetical protein [Curtobacterium caseinilyticum]MDM7892419.1 hypothetical protein [Curtobacterium caseinilyticum]